MRGEKLSSDEGERIKQKGQLWIEGNPFNPFWKSVDSDSPWK